MNLRDRRFLLVVNYLSLIAVAAGWAYAVVMTIAPRARVTELDRAGVFNEAELKEYSPRLAEDLRNNVGDWIAEGPTTLSLRLSKVWLLVTIINLVGLHLAGRSSSRVSPRAPQEDLEPQMHADERR